MLDAEGALAARLHANRRMSRLTSPGKRGLLKGRLLTIMSKARPTSAALTCGADSTCSQPTTPPSAASRLPSAVTLLSLLRLA